MDNWELNNKLFNLDWLKLQLTRSCNLSCEYCSQADWKFDETIDYNTFKSMVLDRAKVRLLIITGGEPFTKYELLKRIIKDCFERQIETGIFTNGTLIDESKAKEIKQLGVSWIRVSLNGSSETIHELSYPKGSFEKTVNGIKQLINNDIQIKVRSTVTQKNMDDIKNLIDYVSFLGINEIDFRPYMSLGDCNPHADFSLTKDQLIDNAAKLVALQQKRKDIKIKLLPNWFDFLIRENLYDQSESNIEECHCGRKYLYVDAQGNYRACAGHRLLLGSMFEKPVEEVWEKSPFLKEIRYYTQDTYCDNCPSSVQCHKSNCHLINYEAHERFDKVNPMCPIYLSNRDSALDGYNKIKNLLELKFVEYGGNLKRSENDRLV